MAGELLLVGRLRVLAIAMSLILPTIACPSHAHDELFADSSSIGSYRAASSWNEIGELHGDIAISRNGEIYVSAIDPEGGMHVFDRNGVLVRKIEHFPTDVHGFVIREEDGEEFIYATQRYGDAIIYKTDLVGNVLLSVAKSTLPQKQYWRHPKSGELIVAATSIAIAPNGIIYVITGYGGDRIHRFDQQGNYIGSWDGKSPELNLDQAHKIYLDTRFTPPRLLITDRRNERLVHLSLEGELLGVHAENLRLPSAVAFFGDRIAVAEIAGRISILDRQGGVISTVSQNDDPSQIATNTTPPGAWPDGVVVSPHGLVFDGEGRLLVTEWNKWGRILIFDMDSLR